MASSKTQVPHWNPERCLPCGGCTGKCPARIFTEQAEEAHTMRGRLARTGPSLEALTSHPPCRTACPLGQDVPGYITAIARRDFPLASRLIGETNPMPSICGRLCPAPCLEACVRHNMDKAVAIRALKQFAIEQWLAWSSSEPAPAAPSLEDDLNAGPADDIVGTERAVAIVGAGPAGLSAAWMLARLNRKAVVFEAASQAGGLLGRVVAPFELPETLLKADIARILASGIELRMRHAIKSMEKLTDLHDKQGFGAVLLATGASRFQLPGLKGADSLQGIWDGLELCSRARSGALSELEGPVVVMGSGVAALTAARVALRLGGSTVHLVYPRSREETPALQRPLGQTEAESIQHWPETAVCALKGKNRLESVGLMPLTLSRPDPVGRRRLSRANREQAFHLQARQFVAAGLRLNEHYWLQPGTLNPGPLGNLMAGHNWNLGPDWLFGAGEAVTGAKTVVEAMATGIAAAREMDAYLGRAGL